VAHPFHQLQQARALSRRHRVPGVAQVVKMQLRETDRFPGLVPEPPEVRPAKTAADRADEYQAAAVPGLGEAPQVPAQLRHDLARERDRPGPGA
jgi:hypothetical protein